MSKRLNMTIGIAAVLGPFWLSGCTTTGTEDGVNPAVTTGSANPVVQEVVRIPTAEARPEDVPDGLLVADAEETGDKDATVPAMVDMGVTDRYRIGPTDVLGFRSFDDESLNTDSVQVRHDGFISLPWVPDIKVTGLTREEATEAVQNAYKELYYEAEVSLQILQATSRTYTVMGDVNSPREYPYLKPISLLDAIISAGSLRVNQRGGDSFVGGQGQLVKAFIVRGEGEERTVSEYDLRNMETGGPHASQTPVLPDDIVFIPEGINLVYVLGAVGRQGVQPLTDGMTLLQLLTTASGLNESVARMNSVVLIREIDASNTEVQLIDVKKILKTGMDIVMQPGDIVYVPRKRLVNLGEFISRSTGLVTPILGVTSQAIGLYSQVYDAFYTEERIDLLYNSDNSSQLQTNLQVLDALRTVGSAAQALDTVNNLSR